MARRDVVRFHSSVPEGVLSDLRDRLRRTRWPDEIEGSGWDYGTNLAELKELVSYWADTYDWREREVRLNEQPHFRAHVDGMWLHFLEYRGRGPDPLPILVTHGWPSSFLEMLRLAPRLADPAAYGGDPADAFTVVVPSLPGTGFSERPRERGMTKTRMADLFAKLMTKLGYDRFAARGGDIGSGVTAWLAFDHPGRVVGIHVSDVIRPAIGPGSAELTPAERALLEEESRWRDAEGAYDHIQATKPQTLGYALNDSPAGLAAWIIEKLRSWSDCGGDVLSRFSREELLDLVTLYWVTETINSSNRLYFERDAEPRFLQLGQRVEVPCAVAIFPGDIARPPREWGERAYNVRRWTVMPRGGHFAAHEEPDLLAEDMRQFFRPLRPSRTSDLGLPRDAAAVRRSPGGASTRPFAVTRASAPSPSAGPRRGR